MAATSLRLSHFLRSGLRTSWLASRAYSNGGATLPLTFGSPSEVSQRCSYKHWSWCALFRVIHHSSTQNFYNNVEVKQVDVNSTTGTFGILPNHVPTISVLKPGLVVVYEQDDKQNKFFGESPLHHRHACWIFLLFCPCYLVFPAASSGTVTINADSTVQILVEDAYPLDKLDAQVRENLYAMFKTVWMFNTAAYQLCSTPHCLRCTASCSLITIYSIRKNDVSISLPGS